MSVCISANILLSFQIRQTSQTSLDETQRNINKNIASGPKKIFVVIFLAVTGEFTPEIYLLLSHFKKDIEKICVQWITAKMLKKNSWTVMIVNKCVLWHNVDTACPQFHYLMLTMYIRRFLFFLLLTWFSGMTVLRARDHYIEIEKIWPLMPFPDDPRWGAAGFKDNINRVLHSWKNFKMSRDSDREFSKCFVSSFYIANKMSFLSNHRFLCSDKWH